MRTRAKLFFDATPGSGRLTFAKGTEPYAPQLKNDFAQMNLELMKTSSDQLLQALRDSGHLNAAKPLLTNI